MIIPPSTEAFLILGIDYFALYRYNKQHSVVFDTVIHTCFSVKGTLSSLDFHNINGIFYSSITFFIPDL